MVSKTRTTRKFTGTNIQVQSDRARTNNETVNRWLAVQPYDPSKDRAMDFLQSLRPDNKLIDPSEQFAQSTKTLRPAVRFNTFDKSVARRNQQAKRDKHASATENRRHERMVPNPTLRSALNPKKLPPASLEMQQQTVHDDQVLDEARLEREAVGRKMGLKVKKLKKMKNKKDFRDPRERRTVVGDEL